jgi:RNA polymerase sigma-70 factor (ECF subfamily)
MAGHPEDLEPTRQSLLARLKDWQDQASWHAFFNRYWRLIYSVARRSGLSEDESQEVVQETIITVCKNIRSFEYNPDRGSFRSWLLMLTRQRIIGRWRKKQAQPEFDTVSKADLSHSPNVKESAAFPLEAIWDQEWNRHLITVASEHVKQQVAGKQFQIYDLYVLQNWPVQRVKGFLKVSTSQVYLAKHRVGRLMRKAIKRLSQPET